QSLTALICFFLSVPLPLQPRSTLYPYTTLFRSALDLVVGQVLVDQAFGGSGVAGAGVDRIAGGSDFFWRQRVEIVAGVAGLFPADRKSTRLNSSHVKTSYAVFCEKKKNEECNN